MSAARTLAVILLTLAATPLTAQPRETITVDASAPAEPFPHFWEHMFGSGRAVLSLRESYREDLRAVRGITAVRYVRFHAVLHDEMGVYGVDKQGEPVFNFASEDIASVTTRRGFGVMFSKKEALAVPTALVSVVRVLVRPLRSCVQPVCSAST